MRLASSTSSLTRLKSIASDEAINQGLRAAFELRRSLSLKMAEPVQVLEIASQLGIDVRLMDCSSMEGMYLKDRRPRIFLPHSGHRPRGRILFSCAHELGHHQLGHGTSADMYLGDENDRSPIAPEEVAADTFASHLLMPRQAVASSFERRGIDVRDPPPLECYVVSQELGVGYSALVAQLSGGDGSEKGDHFGSQKIAAGSQKGGHLKA